MLQKVSHLPNNSGIYIIRNKLDGKVYVGQSQVSKRSRGIRSRCIAHLSLLKYGRDSRHLQHAWDKYGSDAFEFEALMQCPNEECDSQEERFIQLFSSWKRSHGYNLDKKARGTGGKSPETIAKIQSAQSRALRSKAMKGRIRITNGKENRMVLPGDPVPEGFKLGMTTWKERVQTKDVKGLTTAFNPTTGETLRVNVDDPRYVSGELQHIAKKKHYGQKTQQELLDETRIAPKNSDRAKGSKWVNNGVENKRIPKDAPLPEGWVLGRLRIGGTGRNRFSEFIS